MSASAVGLADPALDPARFTAAQASTNVGGSLPVLSAPVDTLRQGPGANLKHAGVDTHPVQAAECRSAEMAQREDAVAKTALYGTALGAKAGLDKQILGRVQRLPGGATPSAMLGLQALNGELDELPMGDFFGGDFAVSERAPQHTVHEQMEMQLGMTRKGGLPL